MMSKKPLSAYDVRRYLTLVQVLALDKDEALSLTDLKTMARLWDVNPYGTYRELLQRLAQHVVEYSQSIDHDKTLPSYDPIDYLDK